MTLDLKQLVSGDIIEAVVDDSGSCIHPGRRYTVHGDIDNGFHIDCEAGFHSIGLFDCHFFRKIEAISPVEQYIARELARVEGEPG